jgi:FtsP/CotA-like multicopper oxidase with cupredoxin domain
MRRVLGFLCFAAGCAVPAPAASPLPLQPEGFDRALRLTEAEDLSSDDALLEVNLEARPAELEVLPGTRSSLWTYNGMLPGPLLRAKVGDRLVVHFTNSLPEPTSIHWHGLRLPNAMDGSEHTQTAVAPGGSFTYDFTLLDPGTYWYHPHFDSSAQVGFGLYGALVVEDPSEPELGDAVTLMLSDASLERDGGVLPGNQSGWFGDYFGREGDVLLVNGKVMPTLEARAGAPQRWRVINASRARYWKFKVPKATVVRVGGDDGLAERPMPLTEVLLVPGERAELWVRPEVENTGPVPMSWLDSDRFHIQSPRDPQPFMKLNVVAQPRADAGYDRPPSTLRSVEPLEPTGAVNRRFVFGEKTGASGTAVLTINGVAWQESPQHFEAFVGDTELWQVENDTGYDHPFHLHGFQFQLLEAGTAPWPVREWKDTVNLVAKSKVRFLVKWDDRPGMWMFHCHILDHVQLGMMAAVELKRR